MAPATPVEVLGMASERRCKPGQDHYQSPRVGCHRRRTPRKTTFRWKPAPSRSLRSRWKCKSGQHTQPLRAACHRRRMPPNTSFGWNLAPSRSLRSQRRCKPGHCSQLPRAACHRRRTPRNSTAGRGHAPPRYCLLHPLPGCPSRWSAQHSGQSSSPPAPMPDT
jgi:hypothetical protein